MVQLRRVFVYLFSLVVVAHRLHVCNGHSECWLELALAEKRAARSQVLVGLLALIGRG